MTSARTKFLIGGALVLGTAGYLMATSIQDTGMYYLTPSELTAKLGADPSFRKAGVKVGARVIPGSIRRAPGGKEYAFTVTDGATSFPVAYRGLAPDTFTDGVDVVIEGRMADNGTFNATVLLAKCASRYENEPGPPGSEKYKQTPGYKSGATG